MIVLDTNVLSELMRPDPNTAVTRWIAAQVSSDLFITAITQAEILFGAGLLPVGRRRSRLLELTGRMFSEDLAGRILPFDGAAAERFASVAAGRRHIGRPIQSFDAQIAAIALSRGAAVATRNVSDFEDCGLTIIDPWRY
jgi:predicted nucleic acid-binding protein